MVLGRQSLGQAAPRIAGGSAGGGQGRFHARRFRQAQGRRNPQGKPLDLRRRGGEQFFQRFFGLGVRQAILPGPLEAFQQSLLDEEVLRWSGETLLRLPDRTASLPFGIALP